MHILTQHSTAIGQHATQMRTHSDRKCTEISAVFLDSILSITQQQPHFRMSTTNHTNLYALL
jgi:hypothetical protein